MARSKNGWLVEPPATRKIRARNGDTADVRTGRSLGSRVDWLMQDLVREYEKRIEPVITVSGYRTAGTNAGTGTPVSNSNHRSATAIDINGFRYPYEYFRREGYQQKFTGAKLRIMRALLRWRYRNMIRWGHDFESPYRDEMHFEIRPGVTNSDLARLIRLIRKEKRRAGYGKVQEVKVARLNGRNRPSTKTGKIKTVRKRGFRFRAYDVFYRNGRKWYMTKYGTFYAADYCKTV